MKNKTVTYLLLAVVGLVWGLIVWKIMSHGEDTDYTPASHSSKTAFNTENYNDTLALYLNYPDPFSGGNASAITERGNNIPSFNKSASVVRISKKPQPVPVPVEVIDWGFIKYSGLIGNRNNTSKIGLVYIQDREHVIKEKEVFDNITFSKITKDSLYVSYKKQKHIYLRGR